MAPYPASWLPLVFLPFLTLGRRGLLRRWGRRLPDHLPLLLHLLLALHFSLALLLYLLLALHFGLALLLHLLLAHLLLAL